MSLPIKESKLSDRPSEKLIKVENTESHNEKALLEAPLKQKTPIASPRPSKHNTPEKETNSRKLFENKDIELIEDIFGVYYDEDGKCNKVKRYTWKNHNKVQVQVITYGARITSMKMPDRKGAVEDIILGFDDLEGYLYYQKHLIGATIGRVTSIINHGTYSLDGTQYFLCQNKNYHHVNGGANNTLDSVIWTPYVDGKSVIMSYISPNHHNGYPGDVFIKVKYELSARNEFNINMEAQTTQPTIINLSNLSYFNLAGHYAGPDELYKHILTMNCNCFTPMENDLPTGDIMNVLHTDLDFQIPKILGKVIGVTPKDGFNQNLCVNRGCHQEMCFIARILHPPSGRMLELYSNQPGVNFNTANDFGYGEFLTIQELIPKKIEERTDTTELERKLQLLNKIHGKMMETFKVDKEKQFEEIIDLIIKIKMEEHRSQSSICTGISINELVLTPVQYDYLESMLDFSCKDESPDCRDLLNTVEQILKVAKISCEAASDTTVVTSIYKTESQQAMEERIRIEKQKEFIKSTKSAAQKRINVIPPCYKDINKIVGKCGANYRMHGAIALQTQNYPNAVNCKNFPNCVLRPGQTYKHDITYKFWVRAGNPNKWIKRNLNGI